MLSSIGGTTKKTTTDCRLLLLLLIHRTTPQPLLLRPQIAPYPYSTSSDPHSHSRTIPHRAPFAAVVAVAVVIVLLTGSVGCACNQFVD